MDLNKIGKFISKKRREKKITQESLAELLGINNRTVSRWENGKNMPDVSLYKPLCEILEISVEELINGEENDQNNIQSGIEKAIIDTVSLSEKSKKKQNKIIKLLILIIIIVLIAIVFVITYYDKRYPKINIYSMDIIKDSEENNLKNMLTVDNSNIYFYGIKSFQLIDEKSNYYDLKNALIYKQTNIEKIKKHLELQYKNGNMNRFILYDGGTTIYKNNKYEVIVCNTLEDNNDLYFGLPDIEEKTKGAICGKDASDVCYFTRTFHIVDISETNDEDFVYITVLDNKGNKANVKINNTNDVKAGKDYEFVFSTYNSFSDNVKNIFEHSTLIKVTETNKVGQDQINEEICVNK